MSENMYVVCSSAFRFFFLSVVCHSVAVILINIVLEKRHKLNWLIIYGLSKIIIVNTFLGLIIKDFHRDLYAASVWLNYVNTVCVVGTAVFSYVIICYTYKGEFIKIAMAALAGEITASFFGYFSIGIINSLEGRYLFSMEGEFQILDLGIPIICYTLMFLFYQFFKSIIMKVKDRPIKHKKICWTIFILFIGLGVMSLLKEYYEQPDFTIVVVFLFAVGGVAAAIFLILTYKKELLEEQSFMEDQLHLLESHYHKMKTQICYIEEHSAAAEKEIEKLKETGNSDDRTKRIIKYQKNLAAEYQLLKHGMHCSDWMLDAVLSDQIELAAGYGIEMEFSMQEYREDDTERIVRQDLISLILFLVRWGIRANQGLKGDQDINFHFASVKNQLLIQFTSGWNGKEQITEKILKRYIQKYDGTTIIQKEKAKMKLTLALQKG